MGDHPQIVYFNREPYFVCEGTGALIKSRFFLPTGPHNDEKKHAFSSLPVALRWLKDQDVTAEEFDDQKRRMCEYFNQPDIPIQPENPVTPVGIEDDLIHFLSRLTLGENWRLVSGAEHIDAYLESLEIAPVKQLKYVKPEKRRKRLREEIIRLRRGIYLSLSGEPRKLHVVKGEAAILKTLLSIADANLSVARVGNATFIGRHTGEDQNQLMLSIGLVMFDSVLVVVSKETHLKPQYDQLSRPKILKFEKRAPEDLLFG